MLVNDSGKKVNYYGITPEGFVTQRFSIIQKMILSHNC